MGKVDKKAVLILAVTILAIAAGTRLYTSQMHEQGEMLTDEALAAAGYDQNATLLGRLVYGEARGEPYVGQVAVAAVIMNRTQSTRFPPTIAGVIFQPGAFDAVSDGQIWQGLQDENMRAARAAIAGWDPSGGALFYWNPATATSRWIWSRKIITQIGKHVFGL